MIQKINFNDCVAIRGMGRVDETRPIDLQEYVIPKSKTLRATPLPIMPIPQKICISNKIGKTVYDVTANFSLEGKETILQQFKNLILSAKLKQVYRALYNCFA